MGINSLQNYVNKHNLNLPHHLRDSKLVIYGNSFAKYLFYYLPMEYGKKSYFYGGDYADLKTYLRKLFDKFAQCNVQPIVVFDGGSKIAKALRVKHAQDHFAKRLKRAIETCESTDVNDHKFTTFDKPHWPSNTTVLFQVLRELNIAHVQCVAREADDIIPVIARY